MDQLTLKLLNARELLLLRGKFLFNNYVRDIYFIKLGSTVDEVHDLFILIRHVLTAAHCLCRQHDKPLGHWIYCLQGNTNQIRPRSNEIYIYGGRRFQSFSDTSRPNPQEFGKYRWKAYKAYAMPLKNGWFYPEDIGIIIIPGPHLFFDRTELSNKNTLRRAKIVPICLGRENVNLDGLILTGAGWGRQYVEFPEVESPNDPRDPLYSSCMASEQSLKESRFRHCDMRSLKDSQGYKCRTKERPTGMQEDARCEEYWAMAHNSGWNYLESLSVPIPDREKMLKNSIVKVRDIYGGEIVCIEANYEDFDYGWCPLIPLPEEEEKGIQPWGVCSPSCSEDLMNVSK